MRITSGDNDGKRFHESIATGELVQQNPRGQWIGYANCIVKESFSSEQDALNWLTKGKKVTA